jgi:hypothetical protein
MGSVGTRIRGKGMNFSELDKIKKEEELKSLKGLVRGTWLEAGRGLS